MTIKFTRKWEGATNDDPIAQTFRIKREMAPDSDGCYLSSIDLYFQSKSETSGVTVDLRSVENGYPTRTILPYSTTHLLSKQIYVSEDASLPTKVVFPGPVYVKVGEQYAVTIKPDGNLPDVKIWIAINGRTDVQYNAVLTQNWGDGAFFASASSAWLPKLDRDIKFRVYRAVFDVNKAGRVTMTNADLEFLTMTMSTGSYNPNEEVYKVPASFNTGTITMTAGSANVTGSGTTFSADYAAGDTIVVRDNANNNLSDVVTIKEIASSTAMTIVGASKITTSDGRGKKTPTAIVQSFNVDTGELVLRDSTASNTAFRFTSTDVIKGCDSAANGTITSVDNKILSYFQPHLYRTEAGGSKFSANVTYSANSNLTTTSTRPIIFGLSNNIKNMEAAVFSKSNEANATSITKSFVVESKLTTTQDTVSPTFDTSTASIQMYTNIISANNTGERGDNTGFANSKYVSKIVTLASGLEAEDLQVYVTAYKPANTSVEVYCRIINNADADKTADRQWTKMDETEQQKNTFSSDKSARDMRELSFTVPRSPTLDSTTQQTGTANTTAGSNVISIASASTYYSVNDIIIVGQGLRTDYALGRVASANSTAVTLYNPLETGKDITNGNHYKVAADEKRSAFKYPLGSDSYKLVYFDSQGREYNNYNFFQVKVVLLANTTNVVPRISDIRAVALTG